MQVIQAAVRPMGSCKHLIARDVHPAMATANHVQRCQGVRRFGQLGALNRIGPMAPQPDTGQKHCKKQQDLHIARPKNTSKTNRDPT